MFVLLSLVLYLIIQTTTFFRHYAGTGDVAYSETRQSSISTSELMVTLQKCWKYVASVFIIFLVSLTVFPSVTVLVVSQYYKDETNIWAKTYFTPVTCFLAFNCGDYLGRYAHFQKHNHLLHIMSIIMACHIMSIIMAWSLLFAVQQQELCNVYIYCTVYTF